MLKGWVNKKYLDAASIKNINKKFRKSKPYPNFVLGDFFNKEKLLKLKKEVLKEKYEKVDRDLFTLSHTNELKYSENSVIKEFYNFLSSKEFISIMHKLANEKLSRKIDMQSHSMVQGDYLLFHDDVVEQRKIAYVVYLSTLQPEDGGSLRLYDIKNPANPVKKISPAFNSFACFKVSKKSLHDVGEIKSKKQRLTIGGWFYGD